MKNEIKEILFLLHNDRLTESGKRKLEDYITNLQEENERLKNDFYILKKLQQKHLQEIERLNNIINELEKILVYEKNDYGGNIDIETRNIDSEFLRGNAFEADYILGQLQELKGSNSNE